MTTTARSLTSRRLALAVTLCTLVCIPLLSASATEKTTLTFLMWGSDPDSVERARLFEKDNPGVKIEHLFTENTASHREKILTMHAAGIAPDLFLVSRSYQYELWANGLIQPLTKYINDPELRFKDLVNTEQMHVDGEYIGIPHHGGGQQLVFNADVFAHGGVEPADELFRAGRWDLDNYVTITRKLTRDLNGDGIPDIYGTDPLRGMSELLSLLRVFGTTLLDPKTGDPRINTPQGIEAIRYISDLRNVHGVVGGNAKQGTQAVFPISPRAVFSAWGVSNAYPFDWNIVPFPKGALGHRNVGGHNFYAISSQSTHPEHALAFIKFELRPELIRQQLASGAILTPVRASTFRDPVLRNRFPNLNLDVYLAATSDYLIPETVKVPGANEAEAIAVREVALAVQGTQSAEQTALRIHDEIVRTVLPKYRR